MDRATRDQLRADAAAHALQIEAVRWMGVADLAARWSVSNGTVRKIDRAKLPYLLFGDSEIRRYDPRDVEQYEQREKVAA